MTPLITIAVQCHNFQRRLCWMLSSIEQQTKPDLVAVRVDHMPNNGTPSTESVLKTFGHCYGVEWHPGDLGMFEKRGWVRNLQMEEIGATPIRSKWLLWGDIDHVFHPEYFERLAKELENHKDAPYLIASGRRTTDKEVAILLVDREVQDVPRVVPYAFYQAHTIQNKTVRPPRGIGNFQLVNVKHGAHGGCYVETANDRGWSHPKGQNTKSDVAFRKRMVAAAGPVRALPEWFSHGVIHLNHERDADIGKHCEIQR